MSVNTNYQVNFKGLVPKEKYSGTPRLSQTAIEGLKKIKCLVREADNDILEAENHIAKTNSVGGIAKYLKDRLSILNRYRRRLMSELDYTREMNEYDVNSVSEIQKDRIKESAELDDLFEKGAR